MDQATKSRLLQSISNDRLVVLCGAGLSMAPPSQLPSAWHVARACHEKYCNTVDPDLDPTLKDDLEALAEHFDAHGNLIVDFIRGLVPWQDFTRPANPGHEALADFLICRAIFATLSSNYDDLIERPARQSGADLQVALDGDQANVHAQTGRQSPLLKFHGCANDRDHTVWTKSQLLSDVTIAERVEKTRIWMEANLREKDLLVIGFWSDWSYLNSIIGSAFENVTPHSVTVVDPTETLALAAKAPELWALAHSDGVSFFHVQESGADLLDELRRAFSTMYLRQVLAAGEQRIFDEFSVACDPTWLDLPLVNQRDLYRWRADAEGCQPHQPPRRKQPEPNEMLGHFHLLLRRSNAAVVADGYVIDDRTVRVINGLGRYVTTVQQQMMEPPAVSAADIVVCVGSDDSGLPGNIVRSGEPGHVVKPAAAGQFVNQQQARDILGI